VLLDTGDLRRTTSVTENIQTGPLGPASRPARYDREIAVATRPRRDARSFDRELAAGLVGQLLVLGALTATVGLSPLGWVAGCVFSAVVAALLASGSPASRAAASGAANRVTLTRATLVGGVAGLIADQIADEVAGLPVAPARIAVLLVVASVALALDLVDGWVARRTDTVSELGARFDMELDALLILVLSVLVCRSLGYWVLALGLMRYLFVLAGHLWSRLTAPLPFSRARKVVAAVQGVVLVVAAAPFVPRPLAALAVAAALATLLWSFGRDALWLVRNPPVAG
jgi:phosphatidylglycerophosphate synthase